MKVPELFWHFEMYLPLTIKKQAYNSSEPPAARESPSLFYPLQFTTLYEVLVHGVAFCLRSGYLLVLHSSGTAAGVYE